MARDGLKPFDEILKSDIRHRNFGTVDQRTGEFAPRTIESFYAEIEAVSLTNLVPEEIAIQYDVARNILIYAWFEYRFFNVAEAQVLNVLELAIRERIGKERYNKYCKKYRKRKGMRTLIEYCRDHQLVRSEQFSAWQISGYQKAKNEQLSWAIDSLKRTGEQELLLPDLDPNDYPPDDEFDYIEHLLTYVNKIRNNYAHGSTMLHPNVIGTFVMVSEFINQLHPVQNAEEKKRIKN